MEEALRDRTPRVPVVGEQYYKMALGVLDTVR